MIVDTPFPHAVYDNFLSVEKVQKINDEWPINFYFEHGRFTKKWSTSEVPPFTQTVIDSIDIGFVERVTGIQGLLADPTLAGAGLHCIPQGGFLNMHCDFNQHPNGWRRRVNMLIYLNLRWKDSWGGHLILNDEPNTDGPNAKRIRPDAGRCVIFETNERTWHGHPMPLACPRETQRRSLALYFYTDDTPEHPHSTVYVK